MARSPLEVARIIDRFGSPFVAQCRPSSFVVRTLDALQQCRTATLGGHKEACGSCGRERISYNSCGNRHCPKCQAARQALWVEDRMRDALDVKYFHVVFTVPEALNPVCLLDSRAFYSAMFAAAWSTLQTFGYSHYGVETGAIGVLHTWGQNLSLHPHIHCLVPAAGITLEGNPKRITREGQFLYPVRMLSAVFRAKLLTLLRRQLKQRGQLEPQQPVLAALWKKPWVVYCEPPLGSAQQIVKYLGQYTHRVAITNHRILRIDQEGVTFLHKDYRDGARQKPVTLGGVEFLRRFCLHILPHRFVKIRYYGILSGRYKQQVKPLQAKETEGVAAKEAETKQERTVRLTGFDRLQCPFCQAGIMHTVELLPKIRAPTSALYPAAILPR